MRTYKELRLLGIVGLVLMCGFSARAETLSGTVVDPQQRVIVGAKVSLTCGNQIDTQKTDGQGHFNFKRQVFPENCKIRAEHPGFAPLELTVGTRQTLIVHLPLAEVRQTVVAKDDVLFPGSLASVSLSADKLRTISGNSEDLVTYAKHLAGVFSGSDHIYVDGLPADHPPPADRIESISVNATPFSPEYSDSSDTHIEIVTKKAERKFQLSSTGFSLGPSAPNGLNSRLASVTNTASFGLAGSVPYLPIAFTTNLDVSARRREEPIEAVVPAVQGSAINSVTSASATDSNVLFGLGADYWKSETLRVNASLYVGRARRSNVDVSGLTLPEAGMSVGDTAREFRATFRKASGHYIYRGGMDMQWLNGELSANSSRLGVSVSGAFIAGGAAVNKQNTQETGWTFKNVLEFSSGKHYWSAGATISRRKDRQITTPNPVGAIRFDKLGDYILSATAGAHIGTGWVTRGQADVRYVSYTAAPFVEAEILRRARLSIRGGLRADFQTVGGTLLSPRVSAVAVLHGFVLRAGTGMFVQNWANGVFLKVIQNDGSHLQRFLIPNTSSLDIESGTPILESNIVSRIAPNLAPRRDWVSKFSVEHPFEHLMLGVEYTQTDGTHLLGSDRLTAPAGWSDLLESNRALRKQQLHFRAQYGMRGQSLTIHYEWLNSFDGTDGPFSFLERHDDLRAEWARSSGASPHNFSVVGNFQLPGRISLTVVDSSRSSAPYNITSGLDLAGNGLYNDRGGRPRNSGTGAAYHSLSLYAYKRMEVPKFRLGSKGKIHLNTGLHVDNLLGNRNYVSFNAVTGSPLFGQPLAALPGRSFRLWLNVDQ